MRCFRQGVENPIHTYYKQDHPADMSPTANMDSTVILVSDFVYRHLGCTPANTAIYTNNQTCNPILTEIDNTVVLSDANVSLYPNPATERLVLSLKDVRGKKFSGEIHDITGRTVRQFDFSGKDYSINRNQLQAGIYFLKIISDQNEMFVTKIIFAD